MIKDTNGTTTKAPLKRLPNRNKPDWPMGVIGLVAIVMIVIWGAVLPVVGLMYLMGVMK